MDPTLVITVQTSFRDGRMLTTPVLKVMCSLKPKCSVYASKYSKICTA